MMEFWTCVADAPPPATRDEATARLPALLAAHHLASGAGLATRLRQRCLPALREASRLAASLEAPERSRDAVARYRDTLDRLESSLRTFSDELERRQVDTDIDARIMAAATDWQAKGGATPAGRRFEELLACSIDHLDDVPDLPQLMDLFVDRCFKGDPRPFMSEVRASCGQILTAQEAGKIAAGPASQLARFADPSGRQLRAWEHCVRGASQRADEDAARTVVAAAVDLSAAGDLL